MHFTGDGGIFGFTSDPNQLKGELYHTSLKKSTQGFGFTIIGGDRTDEFLQVKNVLSDGPAAHDNKMASGKQTPHKYKSYEQIIHTEESFPTSVQ